MIHEPDGVAAEVEALLQRGGQAAADLARNHALRRTHELREAAHQSEQRALQVHARLDAERQIARAQLAHIERDGWWEHASAHDIVQAWDTGRQWREHDPVAEQAASRMRGEMIDRFGIDPATMGVEPRSDADPSDTGYYASHDVTPAEARSWEAETDQPRPVGERGREIEAALLELRESRRIATAAQQPPVADAISEGGPGRAPRARTSRDLPGLGAERERGR